MGFIEDEHVVEALGPEDLIRSAIALARGDLNGVRALGNTEIAHPPIEAGGITAVAIVNEKAWAADSPNRSIRLSAVPSTRRSDAPSHARGELAGWRGGSGRTRTVFERDGLDAEEIAGRMVVPVLAIDIDCDCIKVIELCS
jgi:hypothetical protein